MRFQPFVIVVMGAIAAGLFTPAFAVQGDPLPGIDVSMEQNPGGLVVAHATTDRSGVAKFGSVRPGNYVIRYDSGPNKGKVIKTIVVDSAAPVVTKLTEGPAH